MLKKKTIIIAVVVAIIFIITGIGFIGTMIYELRYGFDETTNISDFSGRDSLINREEYTEYHSHLLGFPSSTEDISVEEFLYRTQHCFLDTTYHIFLRYTMSEDRYAMEKERLSKISINYEDQKQTPIYIDDIYEKPIYVMACEPAVIGMECYEYVILDDEKNEIICVFLQLANLDETNIPKEYLINNELFAERIQDGYNMYYFEDNNGYSRLSE